MLCNMAKVLVLAAVLSGLCPATHANTTVADAATVRIFDAKPGVAPRDVSLRVAQNDIALPPPGSFDIMPQPDTPAMNPTMPLAAPLGHAAQLRIALLLPLRSNTLGAAAAAVRAGVQAAYEREKDGVSISVIETDGSTQNALSGYADATANYDLVIGPLSRSEVTAIAQSAARAVAKPTIALAQPESAGDVEIVPPPQILAMGLSIEEEARQIANSVGADKTMNKAFVISTNIVWQRRAAKAFSAKWQQLGLQPESMELGLSDGFLSASGLVQLKKRMQSENPALLFVALDAGQTAQLRLAVGADTPVYGTSQLNPLALPDWQTAARIDDLNGTRLLDIPWQLQPDHPAVMVYPQLVVNADQQRSADLARLYALGIDAYRVAREIAANHTNFELDGVTGKLLISFGMGPARFERIKQPAIYQDGMVVPLVGIP
jgi:outer membrane PBP1 activator LpoA protein